MGADEVPPGVWDQQPCSSSIDERTPVPRQ
ncbi:hypothetical protein O9929_07945 [Vibrio lentus]|nr:hypothetical protein [Vibrio lentus]